LVVLSTQNDLRRVRDLSFCYICGRPFEAGDQTNHDHVPPKSVFALQDRQPLKLKTHAACNERYSLTDEKIGQLISLQRGQYPQDPADRKLQLAPLGGKMGAIMNLNIDAALWRWIAAFHAALYQVSVTAPGQPGPKSSIVSPFPRADRTERGTYSFVPIPQQHLAFVEVIKEHRFRNHVDRIVANNGKMIYECVWGEEDHKLGWYCFFALNIYEWKTLALELGVPARVAQDVTSWSSRRLRQQEFANGA